MYIQCIQYGLLFNTAAYLLVCYVRTVVQHTHHRDGLHPEAGGSVPRLRLPPLVRFREAQVHGRDGGCG